MKQQQLLIIGKVWPEPKSSAAGSRMMQLIDMFIDHRFAVTFACAAQKSDWSETALDKLGVTEANIQMNDASFETSLHNLQPEIVLFDRFMTEEQFGWKVRKVLPKALQILNTEDIHGLRKAREIAWKEQREVTDIDFQNEVMLREIASIYRCDWTLLISAFEMNWLQEVVGIPKVMLHYLPLFATANEHLRTFEERTDFYTIGNFLHEPNLQAVKYLHQHLWPSIKKELPEAWLHIYGAYCPAQIAQLHHEKQGFIVHGRANNAQEVAQKHSVLLAPLPFGAGLKGKLLEAMSVGTPNVTNAIGAEGMKSSLPWSGYVANDNTSFVKAAVTLYRNKEKWEQAQQNGIRIVGELFARTKFEADFVATLQQLMNSSRKHLLHYVMQHHTLKTSEYLGKWIEEKQKRQS